MDNKKDMSQKERDALKAKREKARRAEAKKKNAEKHAKLIAADKARKKKQKEKAKLQKQKHKEQQAKEKAKAETQKFKRPTEKLPVEPINEAVADTKSDVPKPAKAAKKSEKKVKTSKVKDSLKSVGHLINEKALLKIAAFFKKAFGVKYRVISICLIAAILIATAVPVTIFSYRNWLITTVGDGYDYYGIADDREKEIEISADKQLERAEKLKRHGQKDKFAFFTNTDIEFDKWYSNGKLIFGNVSQNKCDLVVTIFDEESETVLYRSDGIDPGYYISEIRLFEQLAPGEYKTRMFVAGYNHDSNELIGVQYVKVILVVGGEDNEQQSKIG